jgi:hypothetical protein
MCSLVVCKLKLRAKEMQRWLLCECWPLSRKRFELVFRKFDRSLFHRVVEVALADVVVLIVFKSKYNLEEGC